MCGANDHTTNQCPHHPFVKREEVHLLHEGCCSESTYTLEFEYASSDEEIFMAHHCHCNDPNYCLCENSSGSDSTSDSPKHREKIKVCMWPDTGD